MKTMLTAALALSLLGGTAAMAQPDRHDDHGGYNHGGYDQGRDNQGRDNHGGYNQGGDNRDRRDHGDGHGYGYGHDNGRHWARGQRLPRNYYTDRTYYVDYRAHHLRAPPRGYRWVQVDNNYALVAITSGLIASIIANQ